MRNGECGMRNGTATLVAGNDRRPAIPHSAFRTPHSRTLSQPDTPIHPVRSHVARKVGRRDGAIHRLRDEARARRHADGTVDGHVVVPHVHVTAFACVAGVLAAAVARVHGADRDAVLVRHDLDLHVVGVALARVLHGGHLDVRRAGDRADVAVHPLDLDRFAGGDFALPVKLILGGYRAWHQRQGGRRGEQREYGDAHRQSSSWSSSLSLSLSLSLSSCPGRQILMSPPNDSSSSRALPEPRVKLKRCFVFPVSCTGKQAVNSPLNVEMETETLAFSGTDTRTSPSCVPKR